MSEQVIAALTRRGSLATLASVAWMVAARPAVTEAGKAGKKAKMKCKKQVGACRTVVVEICASNNDPQQCEADFLPCCQFLSKCNATAFLDCIVLD